MITKALTVLLISGSLMSFASDKNQLKLQKKANRIHEKCLTIDTHCDTPMLMIKPGFSVRVENKAPHSRVDLPRMKKGGLDASFFAVFNCTKTPHRGELQTKLRFSSPDARFDSFDAETQ